MRHARKPLKDVQARNEAAEKALQAKSSPEPQKRSALYVVHARREEHSENQIVGIYDNETDASLRLEWFAHGHICQYQLNQDIPYNLE